MAACQTLAHRISRSHVSHHGAGQSGSCHFEDDQHRQRFVETLGEASGKAGWSIHACVLMNHHCQLLAETPEGNLVAGMKRLQGVYTQRRPQL